MILRNGTFYSILLSVFIFSNIQAQEVKYLNEILLESFKENLTVEKLSSDKNQSSYLIWVNDSVKPHYHKKHSECIYIVEGGGTFYLGSRIIEMKKGGFILIPEGIIHSFKHKIGETTKVLSVQTPEFFGKDRFWVEKQE